MQLLNQKSLCEYLGVSIEGLRNIMAYRRDFPKKITKSQWSKIQIDEWLKTAKPYENLATQARKILAEATKKPLERIITKDWG
jgi:predicted DNA-binding transcriptional regulator AlpA